MPLQLLSFSSEKKHSVRYDAAPGEQHPLVTSIYVMKEHLPRPFPARIRVTIEAAVPGSSTVASAEG